MDARERVVACAARLAAALPRPAPQQTVTAFGTVESASGATARVSVGGASVDMPVAASMDARPGDRVIVATSSNRPMALAVVKR